MEAMVVLQKCAITHKLAGVRVEKREGDWFRTWAFNISESSAKHEGFDKNTIHGSFQIDPEYPGCPHCGVLSFFQCNVCGKLNCHNGAVGQEVTCSWCGNTAVTISADSFNINSGVY